MTDQRGYEHQYKYDLLGRMTDDCVTMLCTSVGGHADQLATRILDESFVRASGNSEVTWSVAAKVQWPDKPDPRRHHWQRVRNELIAADWDLLLCSAGSLSAILCEHVRQKGRKAIDIGALDVQHTKD